MVICKPEFVGNRHRRTEFVRLRPASALIHFEGFLTVRLLRYPRPRPTMSDWEGGPGSRPLLVSYKICFPGSQPL